MDRGSISLEFKASEDGEIEGYGAIYGNVDRGGDIIAAGAFSDSLASGRAVKMLYQHDPYRPVGVWTSVVDDERGLRVKGRLLTSIPDGKMVHELARNGVIDGLSVGYRTLLADSLSGARVIKSAELWEVSPVTFPMNDLARIDAVKAAEMTERDMQIKLTRDAGLSRSVAEALLRGGFEAVRAKRDAGAELKELADFMRKSA
jgi:uncharacterized protein